MDAAAAVAHSSYQPVLQEEYTTAGWFPYFCILGQEELAVSDPASFCALLFQNQRADGFVPDLRIKYAAALPVQGLLLGSMLYAARKKPEPLAPALRLAFSKVIAQHRYLYEHRDPEQEGLLVIRHPAEDGFGNAPGYDFISPHASIQDPFFNTCLTWSNEALIAIGHFLGEDVLEVMQWHELTIHSMNEKLWDEHACQYHAYDLDQERILPVATLAGILPLAAEIPTQEQAEKILKRLENSPWKTEKTEGLYLSCRQDAQFADFRSGWLGPAWLPLNWMMHQGLLRYDHTDAAQQLKQTALRYVREYGFHDAFATTKKSGHPGLGHAASPAAAALALHWLMK